MTQPPRARHGQDLADLLGGTLTGEARTVTTLVPPQAPCQGGVAVVESAAQAKALAAHPETHLLGALIVPQGLDLALPCPSVVVAQPRIAFAQLSAIFAPPLPDAAVSPDARIDESAHLGDAVSVGAGTVIGAGAQIASGVRIGAGCVIGEGCRIGENSLLHASVTLYPGVTLGARVILHSGAVIGADGFGYAFGPQGALKIHHHGTVRLEDDVEVGANSCIDRGTLGETRIGARSKIDNLCQIGHNVVMESDCIVAGGAAIGGSTVLERGVILGGAVAVKDHIRLGAGARIGGRSSVTKSVPAGETWAGYPAKSQRKWVRELYLLGKLETIWQSVKPRRSPQEGAELEGAQDD